VDPREYGADSWQESKVKSFGWAELLGPQLTFERRGSNLSDIPHNIRVCHYFRQIYDNFMMMVSD
jgi:hypothetical protein